MFCFYFCQHTVPGACFLCNECPDNTRSGDSGDQGTDCTGRSQSEGSAACVETTGYALLALLEGGDTQNTVCLAQWLVRIRSGNGGFWSSQVCQYLHLSVPLDSLIGCFASLSCYRTLWLPSELWQGLQRVPTLVTLNRV